MDLKKIGTIDSQIGGLNPASEKANKEGAGLTSFGDVLGKLGSDSQGLVSRNGNSGIEGVKFSNHAVERMMSRGIQFSPNDVQKLNEAVARAAAKGSKDSLILMNDSALIVSVKNKTVVTVMDKTALKENVFTNIDSTIVM